MPPPPPPLPVGFLLLGMLLLLVGAGCAAVVATGDGVLTNALFGSVALLSLVLVEALWYVRPWVARAVDAWAAACVGVSLLPALFAFMVGGMGFEDVLLFTFIVTCFVVAPCAGARWYVRDRARRLGLAPGPARVPVPVPRP
jgi:hypothetical protein